MDSVNATMLLVVVTVLVVGFYLFTLKPREDVTGAVAPPLHMVVCVVSFILYACGALVVHAAGHQPDAASICNLMVLNKIAVAALMADMVTSFTRAVQRQPVCGLCHPGLLWFYVAAMAAVSVAVKMSPAPGGLVFRLYILLPVYYYGGQKGSGALTWLEQHTGISMRSLWSLKFIKMILPSCARRCSCWWLSTCVVQVETYQQGALYRFGSLARRISWSQACTSSFRCPLKR